MSAFRATVWAFLAWLTIGASAVVPAQETYSWQLPTGFPTPAVPPDNPMSSAKVELGRHLFYDTRMSANRTQSCATCHEQERAFTEAKPRSVGSTGQQHPRASMSLVNVAYAPALTWGNPALTRLEDQILVPMYGEHPVELGLDRADRWLDTVKPDPVYRSLFRNAYPETGGAVTRDAVVKALASFVRSIVSARSPYDRYHFERDDAAVSAAVKRGEILFHSRPLSCFTCHGGFNFSPSSAAGATRSRMEMEFHNTGLYNLAGVFSYPEPNTGIHQVTNQRQDVGKFKPPTLRNVAVTAPYMHDSSVATLDAVIDHYSAGGRTLPDGPYKGVGRDNPNKTERLQGFTLTDGQRSDLLAFLNALTDDAVLRDPRFANPWPGKRATRADR